MDGAETQVRRPQASRPGRRAFVSGKKRQNTIKTTTFSDGQGRMLFSGIERPGRMHDQTALRTEGIAEQFHQHPTVKAKVDSGYQGLARKFPNQVTAPPKSRRRTPARVTSEPGARPGACSPQPASASSTPTLNSGSGPRCAGTPDAATPSPRPSERSAD
ncbi:transposase family protein [Streptomyces mirabilis]|uniref:transposase family protein n=1 Tax=Streptomyces mirabilis TaxID=68239 RepID=UPI0036DEF31C